MVIQLIPYNPPAKLKPAGATVARAILDSPDRAESKLAITTVAPRGAGYELAVTSLAADGPPPVRLVSTTYATNWDGR